MFVKYAQHVWKRYKDKVKYWLTFNEINIACRWVKVELVTFMDLG